jgi:hypothetical protein
MRFPFFSRRAEEAPTVDASDPLTRARELAAEGNLTEANELYWKVKRKQQTAESLVEHAELLLEIGDHFSATSKAAAALALEPDNKRALAVQREVTRHDDEEERRRNRA